MKFTLEINTGNDAALSYRDVRAMLQDVARYMRKYRGPDEALELGDHAPIRDANGNTVGQWKITGTDPDDDGGRTRIGNTPTCEDCGQPLDHCECEN